MHFSPANPLALSTRGHWHSRVRLLSSPEKCSRHLLLEALQLRRPLAHCLLLPPPLNSEPLALRREHLQRYVDNGITCPAIALMPFPGVDIDEAIEGLAPSA